MAANRLLNPIQKSSWFFWLSLTCILMFAIATRLWYWPYWFYLDDIASQFPRPILSNIDGYFYLALARDILEHTNQQADWLRVFPDTPPRPSQIPLLPVLTAWLSKLTTAPLELIATLSPAFYGALIAIPVALIVRQLENRWLGLAAAFFVVILPYFVQRTILGWFDTDSLNLVLPFSMAALAMSWLKSVPSLRGLLVGFGVYGILFLLLLRWWDQALQIVALLSVYPLLVVLLLRWADPRLRYASLVMLGGIFLFLPISINEILTRSIGSVRYVSNQSNSIFSPASIATPEQQALDFAAAGDMAAGGWLTLGLSLLGLAYCLRHRPLLLMPLAPFLVIGTVGLFEAQRFLIFLTPVTAIGLAGILALVQNRLTHPLRIPFVALLFIAISIALIDGLAVQLRYAPNVPKIVVENLDKLQHHLPQNAVIWNACKQGHAHAYWTRRATTCDGASHTSARRTYMSVPYFVESPLVASRFIHFYLTHGASGMTKLLDQHDQNWPNVLRFLNQLYLLTPTDARLWLSEQNTAWTAEALEQQMEFLFPAPGRPAYLLVDAPTMQHIYWWYWFASWDPVRRSGIHPNYILLSRPPVTLANNNASQRVQVFYDNQTQGINLNGEKIPFLNLKWTDHLEQNKSILNNEKDWLLDVAPDATYAVIHQSSTANTVGHKLYMQKLSSALFEPVVIVGGDFQIWRVYHPDESPGHILDN